MNPVLEQIYATILPAGPYVIAAYALMWAALLVFVLLITIRLRKTEAQMHILEEMLASKQADTDNSPEENKVV